MGQCVQVELSQGTPVFLPTGPHKTDRKSKFVFEPRRKWGAGVDRFIALRNIFEDICHANSLASSLAKYRDNSRRRDSDIWYLYMPDVDGCGEFLYRFQLAPDSEQ
jgi:hypothetical protein